MIRFGKAYKSLIALLLLCSGIFVTVKAWQKQGVENDKVSFSITGLVYHRFGDARYPSTNTSVQQFDEQLRWLKQNAYQTITANEAYNKISKGMLGEKLVCITVDDGYRSFMENGLPLLEKYGMKATLYVNTESVGWADYLTWQELKDIQARGVEIGNHSHKHSYFLNTTRKKDNDFELDLMEAEDQFKKHLGKLPKSFAYPYGEFDQSMAEVLMTKGYQLAFAQFSGVWSEKTNLFSIPRFPMSGTSVSLERFAEKVKMKQLYLEGESSYPSLINSSSTSKYRFSYNNKLFQGPFNCFINGQQISEVTTSEGELIISLGKNYSKRRNTLTVTTRDGSGVWYWHSSLFINPEIDE